MAPALHLVAAPRRPPREPVAAPGLARGDYPMRATAAARPFGPPPAPAARRLREVRAQQAFWAGLDELDRRRHLRHLRARLARDGDGGTMRARVLGCVAEAARRALGRDPYDTQILCADRLLDGHLVEMATGEGKTLAAALAAAAAALGGVPVHLMTANDYLVDRDATQFAPYWAALGLRCGRVLAGMAEAARRAAYACDVTVATAREIAFDHLRDREGLRQAGGALARRAAWLAGESGAGSSPRLRGLCMAIVDEADSLLIDEATLPLCLAEAHDDPAGRAACFQALALARQLAPGADLHWDADAGAPRWTEAGLARLEALASGLGGAWLNRRHRLDLVGTALQALHRLQPDRDYLVREGRIELLDPVTGRTAEGRTWSRGLQTLVELKEGCRVSPATRTAAQTSPQGFFAGYLRLAGISGTLAECRDELRQVHGLRVVAMPLRRASRRVMGPMRLYADAGARAAAAVARVREMVAQGRPVLVGTEDVAASADLSARLAAAGIAHRVLDARHDADEAAIVAQAGQAGAVTVATRMAGRGTDIALGPGVAALGGLHVIGCQDNPSARLDRQLVGRAARQGDPGSAELWLALDAPAWALGPRRLALLRRGADAEGRLPWPAAVIRLWSDRLRRARGKQDMRQRRRLQEQDRTWQERFESTRLRA